MKNNLHEIYYRVTDAGSYVEVVLFVVRNGVETLVAQQEGLFNNMEEAQTMIDYLEEIGADVRYVEALPQKS